MIGERINAAQAFRALRDVGCDRVQRPRDSRLGLYADLAGVIRDAERHETSYDEHDQVYEVREDLTVWHTGLSLLLCTGVLR